MHGYCSFDWADYYCEVQSVASDGAGGALVTVEPITNPLYGLDGR